MPSTDDDLGTGTWLGTSSGTEVMHVRKCALEVVSGPDAGLRRVFGEPAIVIGRSQCDLVLADRRVSGLHAEVRLDERGYRIRDLGSTNGTLVGGIRVNDGYLDPGATITVGDTAIRFAPLAESQTVPVWKEPVYGNLVGRSAPMRALFSTIDRVAATDATVLITGETGTGKELVAEAIHDRSARAGGPFVVLDCGAIPGQLFEDQLFGHEAGAFTGANRQSVGVFEAADGGTLFIDELGELPLDAQPKLLRAVESRTIRRIGSTKAIECDVRIVAATNRDLRVAVNRGTFRADLYYRFVVAHLHVPPLRERADDIEPLIEHFVQRLGGARVPDEFVAWARQHAWPGNVRELRNAVEQVLAAPETVDGLAPIDPGAQITIDLSIPFKTAKQRLIDAFEARYADALLEAHKGNLSAAARTAGLDRMSMYKLLHRHGIRGSRG
jgi:DNA-binding NtrC family response regulator